MAACMFLTVGVLCMVLATSAGPENRSAHATRNLQPKGAEQDHFVKYLKQYLPPGDYNAYVQQWVGDNASWRQYVDQYSDKVANYTGYIDEYGGQQADYDQYVALYSSMAGSRPASGQNWQGKRDEQFVAWGKSMKGTMGKYVPGAFAQYAKGPMEARAASSGNGGYQQYEQGRGGDDQQFEGSAPSPPAALAFAAMEEQPQPAAGVQRPTATANATQLRQRAEAELMRMESFERDLRHTANTTVAEQAAVQAAEEVLARARAGQKAALRGAANCSEAGKACASHVAAVVEALRGAALHELRNRSGAARQAAREGQAAVRSMAREVRSSADAWARAQPEAQALADQLERHAQASADRSERLLEALARVRQEASERAARQVRGELQVPLEVVALPEQPGELPQPEQPQQRGQQDSPQDPAWQAAPSAELPTSSGGHFLAPTVPGSLGAASSLSLGQNHLLALLGVLACAMLVAHAVSYRMRHAPTAVLMPEAVLG